MILASAGLEQPTFNRSGQLIIKEVERGGEGGGGGGGGIEGSSRAKRGRSEGSMLGKWHFYNLHGQQKPYALHGHVIGKGTSQTETCSDLHTQLPEHAPFSQNQTGRTTSPALLREVFIMCTSKLLLSHIQ